MIELVECPRDAMQGLHRMVPTVLKIQYLNSLLKCGFDTLDFGSFVSPKAIPQMADTETVLEHLDTSVCNTKLLAIVANQKGVDRAIGYDSIHFLGYPLSVSETFQQKNTNSSIEEGLVLVEDTLELLAKHGKELVVYLSMAFGNPYGDDYYPENVAEIAVELEKLGVKYISLADTVGMAQADDIFKLFKIVSSAVSTPVLSVHLHSEKYKAKEKIEAAKAAGCTRFEGALLGFGGCPMAQDDLVGNIDTQDLIELLGDQTGIDLTAFEHAKSIAQLVFY